MKRGFTKAWRKELESEIWLMPPIYHRVWYWLRLKVQYEPYLFPTPKKFGIWVAPGQRVTSYQQIAEGVKWTEYGQEKIPNKKTVMAVIEWLQANKMVEVESNAQGTMITVTNWDIYNHVGGGESNAQETLTGLPSGLPTGHKKRKTKKEKTLSSEALRLSDKLANLVLVNYPNQAELNNGRKEKSIEGWAYDIDLMHQKDSRSWQDIEEMIDWSQQDDFWRMNIRSGSTLRKQYDKMDARRKNSRAVKSKSKTAHDIFEETGILF